MDTMAISEVYNEIGISWILAKLMLLFKNFPNCVSIASCKKKLKKNKLIKRIFFGQIWLSCPLNTQYAKINFYKVVDKLSLKPSDENVMLFTAITSQLIWKCNISLFWKNNIF